MRSNAEIVVDVLERLGTRYVFGYPGGQTLGFMQALRGSSVEFVLVSHEACAGFMADIHGRITGKPGACLSTLGPGATNMTTGVANAYLDRVPLFAFTARMGRIWRNRTVQMQIDHQRLYAPITKWSAELEGGRIYSVMKKAAETALSEPPGPVHLDLPEDVMDEATPEACSDFHPLLGRSSSYDDSALIRAEDMIRRAKHPLVAVGLTMNRAQATTELREFVGKHDLPVVSTLMAKGQIDESDRHFVGVLGRARRDIVAEYCEPADLVIAIGYDPVEFNYEDWLKKGIPLIHIDTAPADIASDCTLPLEICGDIRAILKQLLRIPKIENTWTDHARQVHRRKLFRVLTPPNQNFSPHEALLIMRDVLPSDGIMVSDIGAHTHLIGQLWETKRPGQYIVSNGWSSMGFALPSAIAVKLLRPQKPVIACMGDGSFLMMVGEINTAVRLALPVVFVVFRDTCLSLIKVKQGRKKYDSCGVDLFNSHYRSSDNFFGAPVIVAENGESFRAALEQGLASNMPTVIEAVLDPAEYETLI
jgi:acetolactate synthase-1/2/3 large subunit